MRKEIAYTAGRLYFDDLRCDTLEPTVRELIDLDGDGKYDSPGEGKVYGQTAIPAGRYRIRMLMSPRFHREMPYLMDVPGFTGIMIHPGNKVEDTKGCVLVGVSGPRGTLTDSRGWSDLLNKRITKAIERGESVMIDITD